jgi:DNA-binding MarR family transcriptional regulator
MTCLLDYDIKANQGEGALDEPGKGGLAQSRRSRRAAAVAAALDEQYIAYQYRFVEFFIDHLSDVSRAFRGDMQAMLVLALIGQSWINAVRTAQAEGIEPADLPPKRASTSASRIADITGIPRQTVRRKLTALEKRGWITRNEDGSCRLAHTDGQTAAKRDLSDIDRRALRRVARLFADLEALVAAQETATQSDPEECPELGARNEHQGPHDT